MDLQRQRGTYGQEQTYSHIQRTRKTRNETQWCIFARFKSPSQRNISSCMSLNCCSSCYLITSNYHFTLMKSWMCKILFTTLNSQLQSGATSENLHKCCKNNMSRNKSNSRLLNSSPHKTCSCNWNKMPKLSYSFHNIIHLLLNTILFLLLTHLFQCCLVRSSPILLLSSRQCCHDVCGQNA